MNADRIEWVEIIEPKTKEHMYANLTTGECVWDPPVGVTVKKTDDNQWWELFDENTSRFYYYNATSQKTVWHRPADADIIPLAKLQTLKQNTQPPSPSLEGRREKRRETVSTQTPGRCSNNNNIVQTAIVTSTRPIKTLDGSTPPNYMMKPNYPRQASISSETQTSPVSPRKHHHHHHHHHHHRHGHADDNPWLSRNAQDSGKSSDSSSRSKSFLETSPKKEGIPPSGKGMPPQRSNSTNIPPPSTSSFISNKQKSFDIDISVGGGYSLGHENRGGLPRTKPVIISSSGGVVGNKTTKSLLSTFHPTHGGAADEEEEAAHEKYFSPNILSMHAKKLETTPSLARKNRVSENSSPTVSSDAGSLKATTPEYMNFVNPAAGCGTQRSVQSRSSSSNSSTLASFSKHQSPLIDIRSEVKFSSSEDILDDEEGEVDTSGSGGSSSSSASTSPPTAATPPRKFVRPKSPATLAEEASSKARPSSSASNKMNGAAAIAKRNAADQPKKIPYYSNIDYGSNGRMIPLQLHQYILEQAKSSGYKFSVIEGGGEELSGNWSLGGMEGMATASDEDKMRVEYDSDEFADDEGVSNVEEDEDSSGQEDARYLRDEIEPDAPFLREDFRNSTRNNKKITVDARISDYVVDELESCAATSTGNYYNIAYESASTVAKSQQAPSHYYANYRTNLVSSISVDRPNRGSSSPSTPLETQHASLKRRKDPPSAQPSPALYSPIMERAERLVRSSHFQRRDMTRRSDHAITYMEEMSHSMLNKEKKLPSESDIEKYAQDNFNLHKKGIFRKKSSVRTMLLWSKDAISRPMLVLLDKSLKKEACDLFKLVQIYMGDRKAKLGMTLGNVALEICHVAYNKSALRDELYIQICRQTMENPIKESLRRGWELMAVCLSFFPPSAKFQAYLDSYIKKHIDEYEFLEVAKWPIHVQISHYATVASKRLDRVGVNGKKPTKKPSLDDIEQSKLQIFRPSMFGSTLQEVMDLQKERFPHYKLPWLQTTLSEQILQLQGAQTEGIFRVPADMDEVMTLKNMLDRWEVPDNFATDAHTPASVLKLWYRELYEPLIPESMYEECVLNHDNPHGALALIDKLPEINRYVLAYLVNFLQCFSKSEVVQCTKMDCSNLAMVIAPNCLRCMSQDPRVIFENARKEMAFMRTLIQHMDTSFIEGVF